MRNGIRMDYLLALLGHVHASGLNSLVEGTVRHEYLRPHGAKVPPYLLDLAQQTTVPWPSLTSISWSYSRTALYGYSSGPPPLVILKCRLRGYSGLGLFFTEGQQVSCGRGQHCGA